MNPHSVKAALITGAAHRIGATIARTLATDGWHVVLHYFSSDAAAARLQQDIARAGGHASIVQGDLEDAATHASLIDKARQLAPGLELLVNNASTFPHDTAQTSTAAAMTRCFTVNTIAPISLAQRFAATLPDERDGRIVNILDNRVFAPNPDFFSYGVSKHALYGATQMLALALAPRVRVNGIAPGITLVSGDQSDENFAAAHGLNPLGRGCSPEEIARAVLFIAASPAMTGSVITIDGGQTLANPGRDVQFIAGGPE